MYAPEPRNAQLLLLIHNKRTAMECQALEQLDSLREINVINTTTSGILINQQWP